MSKNCKKNIKKFREAVKKRQKSRKTVNKLSTMLTNCKKKHSNTSKKSKKTVEYVEKL